MDTPVTPKEDATPEDTMAHAVSQACFTLRFMFDAFGRSMQLANFPTQLNSGTFALFGTVLSFLALQEQSKFYGDMVALMRLLLARTQAGAGAIDPRAIENEIAARNIAIAMGPDPTLLQEMVRQAHYRNAVDHSQMETLRQELSDLRVALSLLRDGFKERAEGKPGVSDAETLATLEQALSLLTGEDPGSIPADVPIDGAGPG